MLKSMRRVVRSYYGWLIGLLTLGCLLVGWSASALAATNSSEQDSGSIGLEGTISEAAPTTGATIVTPVNGTVVSSVPITVSGLCPKGLLLKVFSNNVFVGSTECTSGSYSIQVDLFGGQNQLVTRVYDALDEPGPDSNSPTVTFNDAQLILFGTHVALTSQYAKRGADPGDVLDWPIILSGGTGPYALSVDWGDNSATDLMSETFAGNITLQHIYKAAGVYNVVIKVTDSNGTEAFLQVVAVADGAIQSSASSNTSAPVVQTKVIWWPAVAMVPLILAAFWVGRRHELYTLRRDLEKKREDSA
jgi:hypothetical protein